MALHEQLYSSRDELNTQFAQQILADLQASIDAHGQASLLVSGGSTPVALFKTLANTTFAWDKVVISLVDDRWVAEDHADSNAKLVREHLLQGEAQAAKFVSLKHPGQATDATTMCEASMADVAYPFDVLILGMGTDGHTASLFPCSAELDAGLALDNPAKYIATQPTTAPHARMSLTLAAIIASKHIYLHLVGDEKKQVLQAALNDDPLRKPIKAVIDHADVTLQWAP